MAELQLILANSTARVLSNAEISKQAERMEVLLYQLKEEGYEFPGRMRDQVAAACQARRQAFPSGHRMSGSHRQPSLYFASTFSAAPPPSWRG